MLDKLVAQDNEVPEWLTRREAKSIVNMAIEDYMEREGARSIHRAVQDLCEERAEEM